MLRSPAGRLRIVGYLEGTSFLVLLGVAMPLKKFAGLPEAVTAVGWAHGILFMLFLLAAANAATAERWSLGKIAGALVASVVPFGPFVFDARTRRGEGSEVKEGTEAGAHARAGVSE